MKEAFKSRPFLFTMFLIIAVSALSFLAYLKARSICTEEYAHKAQTNNSNEMLWDVLPRQFVSAVRIP